MSVVPSVPESEDRDVMGFTRRTMVGWFDPGQLAATAVKAALSSVFGSYADKRELQAALGRPRIHDYSQSHREIWLDYVADLGDGWDSTYTIAYLISRARLALPRRTHASGADGGRPPAIATSEPLRPSLPRGRILVMGGDQVYPTPTRDEYQDRLEGPYRSALPHEDDCPHLFAIPGNHDWYDGLTGFMRLFCQGRWIGAWKTRQTRSYFAVKLPGDWWLWGTDLQFGSDIDHPQLSYFRTVARQRMRDGERIILCTASPSWVDVGFGVEDAYANLAYLERTVIRENNRVLAVTLTGDLHHYCRYQGADGRQERITAGGGGAYLYPTHRLPDELSLPTGTSTQDDAPRERYARQAVFPDAGMSRRQARKVFRFPFVNWRFGAMMAALYLLYAWLIQSASKWIAAQSLVDELGATPLQLARAWEVTKALGRTLAHAPSSVLFTLVIIIGLAVFAAPERHTKRQRVLARTVGATHGLLHVALCGLLIWGSARLNLHVLPVYAPFLGLQGSADQAAQVVLFVIEMFLVGWLAGGALMGTYLFTSHRLFRMHTNEVFSAQGIEDFKNFLRLHIATDGTLTIHAVGVERICRRWKLNRGAPAGSTWFEPDDGVAVEARARLVEDPIVIPPAPVPPRPDHRPSMPGAHHD
jgi:hypothetical protein